MSRGWVRWVGGDGKCVPRLGDGENRLTFPEWDATDSATQRQLIHQDIQ